MNFALSEEHELLQETVRSWVQKECPATRVREVVDSDEGHAPELWRGMVEMGISGLLVPDRFGGAGLELLDLALVAEELGRGAVPGQFFGHSLATLAVELAGSEAQKERWLPGLASGEILGTIAFGEPGGGWDPASWSVRFEDGALHGTKDIVLGASHANLVVVGTAGGQLALLESGAPGIRTEVEPAMDRTRRFEILHLDRAPAELLPVSTTSRVRDAALVLLAADSFGAGTELVRMSSQYALARRQFDQPIAQFQAVKHQLADMALEVHPTRGLWWFAAHAFDHVRDKAERAAALAKAHITDRVMQVARDAVEVHGGIGFTWECDVHIWFKRALFDRSYLGAPGEHLERVAQLGDW